ncbi:DUF3306 domain-containing protein [Aeromonas hydrophila]|uniref:DUF3306 domain-containing protein n=1 Tax=Aeromonas hydrophila TaxID=644 RepID=UPI0023602CAE|nr:DUF3306 domain-containing protein [Aeromonas hydrophila]WDA25632.1 DUF3306 domain-containing protein [Aeromonas hydrophila]WES91509.1 DUF3306 domain-containing protein [Aeromonas hydrophila]
MSEFLKRWSARKHQALQPREQADPEVVAIPIEGKDEGKRSDTEQDSRVVSTDKGSGEPDAAEGLLYEMPEGKPAIGDAASQPVRPTQPGKSALPDKETLRAMFRTHKPDGLDDYTQDFSQPELLPAALSAGLRNWLVEQATAPDGEAPHSTAAAPEPATVAATAITSEPQRLADNHSQNPTDERDILVDHDGQNVPTKGGGMERLGS